MKKNLLSVILAVGVQTIGAQTVGAQDFVPLQAQKIIYVKPGGTGDGSSWAQACNLENAVGNKSAVGVGFTPTPSQIWVQTGTYYPSEMLIIPDSVKMYGGFSGTETDLSQRDFANNPTIIDAQKKFGSVVRLSPFAELNGFTIQNGTSQRSPHKNGGGVWADDSSIIANCKIINNSAALDGGGIYAKGPITVKNCTIENNTAGNLGHNVYGCCVTIEGGGGIAPFICSKVSMIAQVRTQIVDLSDFESLTVSAIGSEPISYQWYSNTTNSTVGGTPVGTNSPSYTPPFLTVGKLYYYVVATNAYGKDTSNVSGLHVVVPQKTDFDYKGAPQEVTLYPGTYVIECWGSQGAETYTETSVYRSAGGKGAYTKGTLIINNATTFYVYVGQKATAVRGPAQAGPLFNNAAISKCVTNFYSSNGGGATDIRLIGGVYNNVTSLRSRIMVAAAGAGAGCSNEIKPGAPGGALTGFAPPQGNINSGISPTPQTKGGAAGIRQGGNNNLVLTPTAGTLGSGGNGTGNGGYGGSGGAGYYGGGGGIDVGGATGSSFISGHPGCNAINADGTHRGNPTHYSGLVFTETVMTAGNASMPNPRGAGNITGNTGNGFVRITRK